MPLSKIVHKEISGIMGLFHKCSHCGKGGPDYLISWRSVTISGYKFREDIYVHKTCAGIPGDAPKYKEYHIVPPLPVMIMKR